MSNPVGLKCITVFKYHNNINYRVKLLSPVGEKEDKQENTKD